MSRHVFQRLRDGLVPELPLPRPASPPRPTETHWLAQVPDGLRAVVGRLDAHGVVAGRLPWSQVRESSAGMARPRRVERHQ